MSAEGGKERVGRGGREGGKTLVKICGLTRPEDVDAVNAAQPDAAGFILSAGFRRSVNPGRVGELVARLDPRIAHVGVFVNEPVEVVARFTHTYDFNGYDAPREVMVQLHGDEDDDYIRQLRRAMAYPGWWGIPIVKAFTVRSKADVERACQSCADYILLDNGKGTGEVFDWSCVQDVRRKYFLAGGLGPDNVAAAVRELQPFAVDMSSGVETDGVKDPDKIRQAVARARGAAFREG